MIYLQQLVLNLVEEHIAYRETQRSNFKYPHEKIADQIQVLEGFWRKLDPEKLLICQIPQLRELLKQKQIILRDSELPMLLKATIPTEQVGTTLRYSQFVKIFSRALLRGAIANIFAHTRNSVQHDLGRDTDQGQMLKVNKFQRDLVIGGLTAKHDVHGVDAVHQTL